VPHDLQSIDDLAQRCDRCPALLARYLAGALDLNEAAGRKIDRTVSTFLRAQHSMVGHTKARRKRGLSLAVSLILQ